MGAPNSLPDGAVRKFSSMSAHRILEWGSTFKGFWACSLIYGGNARSEFRNVVEDSSVYIQVAMELIGNFGEDSPFWYTRGPGGRTSCVLSGQIAALSSAACGSEAVEQGAGAKLNLKIVSC